MNKIASALKAYRFFSGAEAYIVGFNYKNNLYVATVNDIMPRWCTIDYAYNVKGTKEERLRLYLNNKHKEQLIRKGALCLGSMDRLNNRVNSKTNKGVAFEGLVHEIYGILWDGKKNDAFYECGDMRLNGVEYQIKWENATIVRFNTLKRLIKASAMD